MKNDFLIHKQVPAQVTRYNDERELVEILNQLKGFHVFESFSGDSQTLPYIDIECISEQGIIGLIALAQLIFDTIHNNTVSELDSQELFIIGERTSISIEWNPRTTPYLEITIPACYIPELAIILNAAVQLAVDHHILDKQLSNQMATKYGMALSSNSNVLCQYAMGICHWGDDV